MVESSNNKQSALPTFDELGLKPDLLRGIYGQGYEYPSPIQSQSIPSLIGARDTLAQSQSGTGKTAAFAISVLQRIDEKEDTLQALIFAPTRELAQQTWRVVTGLGEYMGVKAHVSIGGTSLSVDRKALRAGAQIVVGTPGRVLDLMKKGELKTEALKMLVLDEADEMLYRGFSEQIQEVFARVPGDIQVGLFSATIPKEILAITENFMRDPTTILVKNEQLTLEGIKQFYVGLDKSEWKFETLVELYKNVEIAQCIIYCKKRENVEDLAAKMREREFTVSTLHSEIGQERREVVMKEFRTGSSRILITTDLFARGIDISQVSLVINYDMPNNKETYIHRIGRTGRYGKKGVAINFVGPSDVKFLSDVQKFYNTQIEELPMDVSELF